MSNPFQLQQSPTSPLVLSNPNTPAPPETPGVKEWVKTPPATVVEDAAPPREYPTDLNAPLDEPWPGIPTLNTATKEAMTTLKGLKKQKAAAESLAERLVSSMDAGTPPAPPSAVASADPKLEAVDLAALFKYLDQAALQKQTIGTVLALCGVNINGLKGTSKSRLLELFQEEIHDMMKQTQIAHGVKGWSPTWPPKKLAGFTMLLSATRAIEKAILEHGDIVPIDEEGTE